MNYTREQKGAGTERGRDKARGGKTKQTNRGIKGETGCGTEAGLIGGALLYLAGSEGSRPRPVTETLSSMPEKKRSHCAIYGLEGKYGSFQKY